MVPVKLLLVSLVVMVLLQSALSLGQLPTFRPKICGIWNTTSSRMVLGCNSRFISCDSGYVCHAPSDAQPNIANTLNRTLTYYYCLPETCTSGANACPYCQNVSLNNVTRSFCSDRDAGLTEERPCDASRQRQSGREGERQDMPRVRRSLSRSSEESAETPAQETPEEPTCCAARRNIQVLATQLFPARRAAPAVAQPQGSDHADRRTDGNRDVDQASDGDRERSDDRNGDENRDSDDRRDSGQDRDRDDDRGGDDELDGPGSRSRGDDHYGKDDGDGDAILQLNLSDLGIDDDPEPVGKYSDGRSVGEGQDGREDRPNDRGDTDGNDANDPGNPGPSDDGVLPDDFEIPDLF